MQIGFDIVEVPNAGFAVRVMMQEGSASYVYLVPDDQVIRFADDMAKGLRETHYAIAQQKRTGKLVVPGSSLVVPGK